MINPFLIKNNSSQDTMLFAKAAGLKGKNYIFSDIMHVYLGNEASGNVKFNDLLNGAIDGDESGNSSGLELLSQGNIPPQKDVKFEMVLQFMGLSVENFPEKSGLSIDIPQLNSDELKAILSKITQNTDNQEVLSAIINQKLFNQSGEDLENLLVTLDFEDKTVALDIVPVENLDADNSNNNPKTPGTFNLIVSLLPSDLSEDIMSKFVQATHSLKKEISSNTIDTGNAIQKLDVNNSNADSYVKTAVASENANNPKPSGINSLIPGQAKTVTVYSFTPEAVDSNELANNNIIKGSISEQLKKINLNSQTASTETSEGTKAVQTKANELPIQEAGNKIKVESNSGEVLKAETKPVSTGNEKIIGVTDSAKETAATPEAKPVKNNTVIPTNNTSNENISSQKGNSEGAPVKEIVSASDISSNEKFVKTETFSPGAKQNTSNIFMNSDKAPAENTELKLDPAPTENKTVPAVKTNPLHTNQPVIKTVNPETQSDKTPLVKEVSENIKTVSASSSSEVKIEKPAAIHQHIETPAPVKNVTSKETIVATNGKELKNSETSHPFNKGINSENVKVAADTIENKTIFSTKNAGTQAANKEAAANPVNPAIKPTEQPVIKSSDSFTQYVKNNVKVEIASSEARQTFSKPETVVSDQKNDALSDQKTKPVELPNQKNLEVQKETVQKSTVVELKEVAGSHTIKMNKISSNIVEPNIPSNNKEVSKEIQNPEFKPAADTKNQVIEPQIELKQNEIKQTEKSFPGQVKSNDELKPEIKNNIKPESESFKTETKDNVTQQNVEVKTDKTPKVNPDKDKPELPNILVKDRDGSEKEPVSKQEVKVTNTLKTAPENVAEKIIPKVSSSEPEKYVSSTSTTETTVNTQSTAEVASTNSNTSFGQHGHSGNEATSQQQHQFAGAASETTKTEKSTFEGALAEAKPEKIVKSTELIKEFTQFITKKDKTQMVLQIEPAEMGKIKITLDLTERVVKANIEVESEMVRQMVEKNMGELTSQLNKSGIQLGNINISLQDAEKQNKQFAQKKRNNNNNGGIDDTEEKEEKATKSLGYNTYDYVV